MFIIKPYSAIIRDLLRYINYMKNSWAIYIIMCIATLAWSCSEPKYSTSSSDTLTFSADTIHLDTVFSNVPTATRDFWVFNKTKRNIRLQSVRLERGNQSGFRVNVDGVYLGPTTGYQTNAVEVRSGDSIRVFVELTSVSTGQIEPKNLSDNLVFLTEGGAMQKVNLDAYSWDAVMLNDPIIRCDTTFTPEQPIVIYGTMRVDSLATLTLAPGTTLYFRDEASLQVYGRLLAKGEAGNEVTLRGYRLDRMFDYLPYDRISGQWNGVNFHESSYDNELTYNDLPSAFNGILGDSCDYNRRTLTMISSTVHNCQGYGIASHSSWIELYNCQITNTLSDCLYTDGGLTVMNNCTLAQFYPFDSMRGVALRFTAGSAPVHFVCYNTLVTCYADD